MQINKHFFHREYHTRTRTKREWNAFHRESLIRYIWNPTERQRKSEKKPCHKIKNLSLDSINEMALPVVWFIYMHSPFNATAYFHVKYRLLRDCQYWHSTVRCIDNLFHLVGIFFPPLVPKVKLIWIFQSRKIDSVSWPALETCKLIHVLRINSWFFIFSKVAKINVYSERERFIRKPYWILRKGNFRNYFINIISA